MGIWFCGLQIQYKDNSYPRFDRDLTVHLVWDQSGSANSQLAHHSNNGPVSTLGYSSTISNHLVIWWKSSTNWKTKNLISGDCWINLNFILSGTLSVNPANGCYVLACDILYVNISSVQKPLGIRTFSWLVGVHFLFLRTRTRSLGWIYWLNLKYTLPNTVHTP